MKHGCDNLVFSLVIDTVTTMVQGCNRVVTTLLQRNAAYTVQQALRVKWRVLCVLTCIL